MKVSLPVLQLSTPVLSPNIRTCVIPILPESISNFLFDNSFHLFRLDYMPMNLRFIITLLASFASLSPRSLAVVDLENELTLAIVKPDGMFGNYSSSIRKIILESGFIIQTEITLNLAEDTVKIFYAEHSSKSFFPTLVKYMTSGPVLIMVLENVNAIADWRTLIGPTDAQKAKITHPDSIRAMCGEDLERNCVHGSDSRKSAAREISFFFPDLYPEGTMTLKHDEL